MKCEEIENQILEYQEGILSPTQREEVESHLTGCRECRTFARQLEQLDAALVAAVKVPVLSAGFERRLRERIQAVPQVTSEAQRSERKRQLQSEFEAGMARITRQSFTLATLLKHLTWPMLAIAAAGFAWSFSSSLLAHLDPRVSNANHIPLLAASAVFLAVCLAQCVPQRPKSAGIE